MAARKRQHPMQGRERGMAAKEAALGPLDSARGRLWRLAIGKKTSYKQQATSRKLDRRQNIRRSGDRAIRRSHIG
jgi:hypothetical protein